MDWAVPVITAITAIASLGGAAIGGYFSVRAQRVREKHETLRHLNQLAFSAAVDDWKDSRAAYWRGAEDSSRPQIDSVPPLDAYILDYLALVGFIGSTDINKISTDDIATFIEKKKRQSHKLGNLRYKIEDELGPY